MFSVVTFFQDYTQPNVDQLAAHTLPWRDGNPLHPLSPVIGADRVVLPLADGVLSHNLGIPIVVVVTKVTNFIYLVFAFGINCVYLSTYYILCTGVRELQI